MRVAINMQIQSGYSGMRSTVEDIWSLNSIVFFFHRFSYTEKTICFLFRRKIDGQVH